MSRHAEIGGIILPDMIQDFMKPAETGEKILSRVMMIKSSIRRTGGLKVQNRIDVDYNMDKCNEKLSGTLVNFVDK